MPRKYPESWYRLWFDFCYNRKKSFSNEFKRGPKKTTSRTKNIEVRGIPCYCLLRGPRPTSPLDPFGLSKPVWTTDHIPLSSMLDLWYLFVFPMYRWRIRTARPTSYQIPPEMLICQIFLSRCSMYGLFTYILGSFGGKCRQLISHHTFWGIWVWWEDGNLICESTHLTIFSTLFRQIRSGLQKLRGLKNWWFNLVKAILKTGKNHGTPLVGVKKEPVQQLKHVKHMFLLSICRFFSTTPCTLVVAKRDPLGRAWKQLHFLGRIKKSVWWF